MRDNYSHYEVVSSHSFTASNNHPPPSPLTTHSLPLSPFPTPHHPVASSPPHLPVTHNHLHPRTHSLITCLSLSLLDLPIFTPITLLPLHPFIPRHTQPPSPTNLSSTHSPITCFSLPPLPPYHYPHHSYLDSFLPNYQPSPFPPTHSVPTISNPMKSLMTTKSPILKENQPTWKVNNNNNNKKHIWLCKENYLGIIYRSTQRNVVVL